MRQRRQNCQAGIEPARRSPLCGAHDCIATLQLRVVDTSQIQRHPVSGIDRVSTLTMRLNAAHAHRISTGVQLVVDSNRSIGERAGHDRAAALGGEDAIDPQPWAPAVDCRRCRSHQVGERCAQLVEPSTSRRADGDDRCVGKKRIGETVTYLHRLQLAPVVGNKVNLGQRDNSMAQAD